VAAALRRGRRAVRARRSDRTGPVRASRRSADEESLKRILIAAQLHEVGTPCRTATTTAFGLLIEHGDLPGFSTSDQKNIAELVLGQRGNLKKVSALLEDPSGGALLALRLAVILHHARRDVVCERWTCRFARAIDFALERPGSTSTANAPPARRGGRAMAKGRSALYGRELS